MNYQSDQFVEHLVARQPSTQTRMTQVLLVLTALVLSYTLFGFAKVLGIFFAGIIAGVWFAVWYLWRFFNVEYEYSLTNGDLDIDQIYGKRKRKNVLSTHVRYFELIAPVQSERYKQCRQDKSIQTYLDFSSHVNVEGTFFGVFSNEKGRKMVFFEPTEEMLDIMKVYLPRKLFME